MADEAKARGNAAYKKKDFITAHEEYDKAIELKPTDMTFYNNKGAVYFEQKDYDKCIEICEKAVDVGRENRADFKLIAKAFVRIANSYKLKEDYEKAKLYYEKAMSEHRTPETRELLSKVQKIINEKEMLAYVDVEKSIEAKEKGNALFKAGKYPDAIREYTEAIKRNPQDAKIYSNRAACYSKLAEFYLGLKDCEQCIKLEPTFIKGYLRKAKMHVGLKEETKAKQAYEQALEIDSSNMEARQGLLECERMLNKDPEEVRRRAMQNPEVQKIMTDPAMRMVLDQMQEDPNALKEHMQNPVISKKLQVLMDAGILSIRQGPGPR